MIKDQTLKNKLLWLIDHKSIFCCGRCAIKDKCNINKSGLIEEDRLRKKLKEVVLVRPKFHSYTITNTRTIWDRWGQYMEACVFQRFRHIMLNDVLEVPEVRIDQKL